VTALCALHIGLGVLRPDLDPTGLFLTVQDAKGTYTIPYIQPSGTLEVRVEFADPSVARARLELRLGERRVAAKTAAPEQPLVTFSGLNPGEYTVRARAMDASGKTLCETTVTRIGIGAVVAALGDSITEGYYGHGFMRGEDLTARDFPPEAISRDGRNFPQYAPTTAANLPTVNCLESWMTDLNDLLSASWKHPVFIANEGWGGYSTEQYLTLMRTDANWQERLKRLRPSVWLIHLGVNDERAHAPAEVVEHNLEQIVRILIDEYGAEPRRVFVARPCYDYFEGAEPILRSYCARVDALVERLGLSHGPDFSAAYAQDQKRWYGDDPVHPNVEGMKRMAELWHEAIRRLRG
jgi:lysophospholipase L1-like esterase